MTEASEGPVFHIEPAGSLSNRMTQYMVALSFQSLVPGSRISNVQIPEWGIDYPSIGLPAQAEFLARHRHLEMATLAGRARAGDIGGIVYSGCDRRLENFPDVDVCRAAFRAPVASPLRFEEHYLVCHVGAQGSQQVEADPNRVLTPLEFFADIIEKTGLLPVFVGQTAPSLYTDRLRARFPGALILETRDAVLDFETIRQARNIAFGCSTYAWLAAWLSHANRIFMAVSGRFNPMQDGAINLLPFDDPRYHFYLFPINHSVPLESHVAAHQRLALLCRLVPQGMLRRMLQEAPRFDPPMEEMLEAFDPEYYLASNDDLALGAGDWEGARQHYLQSGARERRLPFKLSQTWYATRYPTAALEVGQGDYSTFAHHFVAVGRDRGYRRLPDSNDNRPWWNTDVVEPVASART